MCENTQYFIDIKQEDAFEKFDKISQRNKSNLKKTFNKNYKQYNVIVYI